jgi:hypothetical protein
VTRMRSDYVIALMLIVLAAAVFAGYLLKWW